MKDHDDNKIIDNNDFEENWGFEYAESVENDKHARFHHIMSLFDDFNQGKVLDYGCGRGHNAYALAQKGFMVTGIDYSQEDIKLCKATWGKRNVSGKLEFINCKISDLSENYFDFVLSTQVIEHVHNPGNYLAEINRVLQRGGVLVISLPNIITPRIIIQQLYKDIEKNLKDLNKEMLLNYTKRHDHIMGWDAFHFIRLISTLGFELDKYIPAEGIPLPDKFPVLKFQIKKPWFSKVKRLNCFSRTMIFKLKKIKDVLIDNNA